MDRVCGIILGQYGRNKSFFELSRLLYISFIEAALASYLLTNDLLNFFILDLSFEEIRYSFLELVLCRGSRLPARVRGRPRRDDKTARLARTSSGCSRGVPGCRDYWRCRGARLPARVRRWPERAGRAARLAHTCPACGRRMPGH